MADIDEYELRKSLEHGTRKERHDAAVAAGGSGKDVHPLVLGALARAVWEDESRAVRRAAAESLYRLGDAGFDMLIRMLIDDSIKMRLVARYPGELAYAYHSYFNELIERDEKTRESIIEALGNFKDKRAVRAMIDVLEKEAAVGKEKTPEERSSSYNNLHWSYVSEHLGRIADADIDTLLDALENGCDAARMCVADALGGVGEKHRASVIEHHYYIHTERENVDERVVPALIEALKLGDEISSISQMISRNAAKSLGKLRDTRAVPALIECMGWEEGWGVKKEATRTLGIIGDKSAVPALIRAMPGEDAAYALGRIRDESAIPALKDMLKQDLEGAIGAASEYDLHWNSARALCEFKDVGLDAIADVVEPYVKDRESFDKLVKIVKTPSFEVEDEEYLCKDVFGIEITPILLYIIKYGTCASSTADAFGFEDDGADCFVDWMYLLNDEDFDLILDLLEDPAERVREAAARVGCSCCFEFSDSIGYFDTDDGDVPEQVTNALKDGAPWMRRDVAKMFERLVDFNMDVEYTIDLLIYRLEDSNIGIRDGAARALYNLSTKLHAYSYDRIIKALLETSDDEVIFTALVDEIREYSAPWHDGYYYYDSEVVNPIIMEALLKSKHIALLANGYESIITDPVKELHHEIWDTVIRTLYNKNRYAIDALDVFSKDIPLDSTTIDALIETLNDDEVETVDRKTSAIALGKIHNGYSQRIDEIMRDSQRIMSALSVLARAPDVDNEVRDIVLSMVEVTGVDRVDTRQLSTIFYEYHKSKEE